MITNLKVFWMVDVKHVIEKIQIWIAWHLPKSIVMWCSVRLMAHASQGKWGNESLFEISIMTALKRWETK